jgi:tetratricopeptide (TPR) repeat protein
MGADDFQWQVSTIGGVLPRFVDAILEGGGLEVLVAAAREREDWFCAAGAVRGLCAEGEFGRAWQVVEPFAATGWQPAVRVGADVLVRWGRVDQALELARPEGPQEDAWRDFAEALVRAGRVEDAIGALGPYLRSWRVLRALVEMTEGQGCDDRVLEALAPIAEEFRREPKQRDDLWYALTAQARVLERSGHADEAVRLLGADVAARRYGPQNNLEFYAELLARHGRVEDLRALADAQGYGAARRYVTVLEELGRLGEAEAYVRGLIAAKRPGWFESVLMGLLIRQGRFDDAIEAVEHTFDDLYDGNLLQATMMILAEQGQHDRAIALTRGRSPEFLAENEAFWLRDNRWWLMAEAGRAREAIAEIEALPVAEVEDRELTIAGLLAQDGRVDEAMARLRPMPGGRATNDLAGLLIRQGRFKEAIDLIPEVAAQRADPQWRWS